jgi:phosphatidylserine/phosphatidylglycerophosphate/cardiolipin synthase-like enzyme
MLDFAIDFERLDRRMHNKLFVADGSVAIVGGRNLADEYFSEMGRESFLDFDLLLTGAVVPDLAKSFDRYWNSRYAFPVQLFARPRRRGNTPEPEGPVPAARVEPDLSVPSKDLFGAPPLREQLRSHNFHLVEVQSSTFSDAPEKVDPSFDAVGRMTLTRRFLDLIDEARNQVVLISPYFIPNAETMNRLRSLRAADVDVRVVTNSLAVSDEPLVNMGFHRHEKEMLKAGIRVFELGSSLPADGAPLGRPFGRRFGRLHAKVAAVDRSLLLVGSLNLDSRSATLNTEIGVAVRSREITEMVLDAYRLEELAGTYELQLSPDGRRVLWRLTSGALLPLSREPNTTWWQRLRLWLMSKLVPEGEL